MAGDWIKIDSNLHEKPEVVLMAATLGISELDVVGRLARIWGWADQQSIDGNDICVTTSFFDRMAQLPGFSDALRKAGWLEGRDGALTFPRFGRHNGQTAKNRALTAKRVAKHKAGKSNDEVTMGALPEKIREEKRREEEPDAPAPPDPKPSAKARPSTKAEVVAYCFELMLPPSDGEYMWDHWTGNGFSNGGEPIRDWRAVMRTRKAGGYMPSQKAAAFPPRPSQQSDQRPVKSPPMAGAS